MGLNKLSKPGLHTDSSRIDHRMGTLEMDVYQPSGKPFKPKLLDDTFFFQDILESQLEFDKEYGVVLEVGCGSGYLSKTILSKLKSCVRYSLDLNINACISTQQELPLDALEIIACNMFKNLRQGGLLFDIIIFNPPYVVSCPSVPSDIDTGKSYVPIDSAWAGGIDGRFWIDRFLSTMTVQFCFLISGLCLNNLVHLSYSNRGKSS